MSFAETITNHSFIAKRKSYLPSIKEFLCSIEVDYSTDRLKIFEAKLVELANKQLEINLQSNPNASKGLILKNWLKKGALKEIVLEKFGQDNWNELYKCVEIKKVNQAYFDRVEKIEDKPINVSEYASKVKTMLDSDDVFVNLVGVLAATSRRLTEIFNFNAFEVALGDDYHLIFKNQLKTKDDSVEPYSIPTLFESLYIFNVWSKGLNKLVEEMKINLDDLSNDEIGDKFTFRMNRALAYFYPGLTCHDLRKISSTILVSRDYDILSPKDVERGFRAILGHTSDGSTKSYKEYKLLRYVPRYKSDNFVGNMLDNNPVETLEQANEQIELLKLKNQIAVEKLAETISNEPVCKSKIENRYERIMNLLIMYNESVTDNDRVAITLNLLRFLGKGRNDNIKNFLNHPEINQIIENHHNKFNLTPYNNRPMYLDKAKKLPTEKMLKVKTFIQNSNDL